ncbi:MAG: acetyl-CoA carboxylase biotin carboxyl carrier protein subunit [Bacteroidales bacterium]|nr:acetyl-CoA carboxylase biotin carboxyl carrier protein subunit [Bacteroidales bacterium]
MDCDKKYSELYVNGETYKTKICRKFAEKPVWEAEDLGKITAFIPGTIREIMVKKGQKVEKGEVLLILEAMKMRNRVKAQISGKIKTIHVKSNQIVAKNTLLIELI